MRASLIHKLSSHCKTEAIISGTISHWYATGAGPLRSCFRCERGRWAVVGWERRLGSAPGALPPSPPSPLPAHSALLSVGAAACSGSRRWLPRATGLPLKAAHHRPLVLGIVLK